MHKFVFSCSHAAQAISPLSARYTGRDICRGNHGRVRNCSVNDIREEIVDAQLIFCEMEREEGGGNGKGGQEVCVVINTGMQASMPGKSEAECDGIQKGKEEYRMQ